MATVKPGIAARRARASSVVGITSIIVAAAAAGRNSWRGILASECSSVLIAGGGLAGLAAAAALGERGLRRGTVRGARVPGRTRHFLCAPDLAEQPGETIDNCQHILLRCCVNLLDFYSGWGSATASGSTASSTFWSPAGGFRCCGAAGCPRRCISPARFCACLPRLARQDWHRARPAGHSPGAHTAPGPGPHQHARLAAAEAPDAARHRPFLAAGAGERGE